MEWANEYALWAEAESCMSWAIVPVIGRGWQGYRVMILDPGLEDGGPSCHWLEGCYLSIKDAIAAGRAWVSDRVLELSQDAEEDRIDMFESLGKLPGVNRVEMGRLLGLR